MKKIIEQINSVEVFSKFLEKYKLFRELPEQYKTNKFIALYYRIYNYMLSIPKEKIVVKAIFYEGYLGRHGLLHFLNHFLEAKDFYKWKERIYSLLTEKFAATSKRKYELLYGSKAKEFFDRYLEKQKATCLEKYGEEHPAQSKEVQDKMKATCLEKYGEEHPAQSKEVQDKMKATCLERYRKEYYSQTEECKEKYKTTCLEKYGKEYPAQSKEVQDKTKATCLEKYGKEYPAQTEECKEKYKTTCLEIYGYENPMQSKEVQDKMKATCLAKYGKEHVGGWFNVTSHSKFGNEVCTAIDNILGNPEDSIYYAKSGYEYCIKDNDRSYYIDMVIPSLNLAFEADGVYYHGLLEGQEYVKGTPVEEIHKRDQEKSEAIEKAGFKLFRIREDEYRKDPETYVHKLLEQIKEYIDI